jgi:hypothetical protein
MDDDRERAERIRAAVEATNEWTARGRNGHVLKTHLFTRSVMTAFVAENDANTMRRPEPGVSDVQPVPAAFERLAALVDKYDALVTPETLRAYTTLRETAAPFLSLRALHRATLMAYQYHTFDTVLARLAATIESAVADAARDPSARARTVYCLALPDSRLDKSNLWYSAWAWRYTRLSYLIDVVAPSLAAVAALLRTLDEQQLTAKIFYVDDMTYSGSQVSDFIGRPSDINAEAAAATVAMVRARRIRLQPLVPFVAQTAYVAWHSALGAALRDPRASYALGTYDIPFDYGMSVFVPTPAMLLGNIAESDGVAFRQMWLRDDNRPEADLACAFELYRVLVSQMHKPVVVFEHKLADAVSLNTAFFSQATVRPPGEDVSRALVSIAGGSVPINMDGSVAFYKYLTWTYKTRRVTQSTSLAALVLAAAPACVTCAQPAVQRCGTCQLAFYCAAAECQQAHWLAGKHQIVCRSSSQT